MFSNCTILLRDLTSKYLTIGGGLAGLSTTYHILKKQPKTKITIYDSASKPGIQGASSVAAGLLHPFSPRGKLVHKGCDALKIANELIEKAWYHKKNTVLRNVIYRPIYKSSDLELFQDTIDKYPDFMSWLSNEEFKNIIMNDRNVLGCVKYINGCKVIHVPTYLQGLWEECLSICNHNEFNVQWKQEEITSSYLQVISNEYDIVVLTAGSGLFQGNNLLLNCSSNDSYPITLVRGQTLEVQYPPSNDSNKKQHEALLCGKYISPTPLSDHIIIGATHEFKKDALNEEQVKQELKKYTYELNPDLWDNKENMINCNILSGMRVQTNRGAFGRLPIYGKVIHANDCYKDNIWYLTGLSSRGVLYHGLYGKELVNEIFNH